MTATNHVLTGAVIATAVHNPLLALPVAFMSHFVLDSLPHFGSKSHITKQFYAVLIVDCLAAAAVLASFVISQPIHWPLLVVCGILAASPDLMWLPRFLKEIRTKRMLTAGMNPIVRLHSKIQWAGNLGFIGLVIELAWFGSMLTLLSQRL